jgi:hypothetical protein
VERLDRAFNAGDLNGYLGAFKPLHSRGQNLLAQRIGPILAGKTVTRDSEMISLRQVSNRSIALVRSKIRRTGAATDLKSEETFFLICGHESAQAVPLFQVEVDERELDIIEEQEEPGVFNCLACNYRIQAKQDWLLVPHSNLRVGCIESISFYSLFHDLCIDLSVHVQEDASPPKELLAKLTADEDASDPRSWLPPAYGPGKMDPPAGLSGAQVDVDHGDGHCSLLRLAAYGPIQYLMAVRGPAEVVSKRMSEIEEVLSSFQLIDPIFSPGHLPDPNRPTHLEGRLEGSEYVGEQVSFSGPAGWQGSRSPDWSQFQITFNCPDSDAYIRFQGMPPPKGTISWTQEAADLLLSSSIADSGMRILEDGGWQDGSDLAMSGWTEVRDIQVAGNLGSGTEQRTLRLALDSEVLVLIEANDANRAASELIDASLSSLKQH